MFGDYTTVKLGEVSVRVKRLTLGEIRDTTDMLAGGKDVYGEEACALVRAHCTIGETGTCIEPEELTLAQIRELVTAMVGLPDGAPISNFIGLLS